MAARRLSCVSRPLDGATAGSLPPGLQGSQSPGAVVDPGGYCQQILHAFEQTDFAVNLI